jgi:glycosyltransferase involved in cell wall biosynthesis
MQDSPRVMKNDPPSRPRISVVLPAFNEEGILRENVTTLVEFLEKSCPYTHEVVIAENGSTDNTFKIAKELEQHYGNVRALHLQNPGRGAALRHAWMLSNAEILCYMDVDLSTDLRHFMPLTGALLDQRYDLAVGSRLLKPCNTTRCLKREVLSRTYNLLVRVVASTHFSDLQCGFKAITRSAASALLPLLQDDGWFMDTELLVIAEKLRYRIFELPVRWAERSDSHVQVWRTIFQDLRGLIRLRRDLARWGTHDRENRPNHSATPAVDPLARQSVKD